MLLSFSPDTVKDQFKLKLVQASKELRKRICKEKGQKSEITLIIMRKRNNSNPRNPLIV